MHEGPCRNIDIASLGEDKLPSARDAQRVDLICQLDLRQISPLGQILGVIKGQCFNSASFNCLGHAHVHFLSPFATRLAKPGRHRRQGRFMPCDNLGPSRTKLPTPAVVVKS